MNYEILDSKVKTLIKLCKETENHRTLGIVIFVLLSNLADEIGIKLGFRPRDKDADEPIFRYIRTINLVLRDNFKMSLFDEHLVQRIQDIELIFIKHKGVISYDLISEMYSIYYEFRKLSIPNLYKKIDVEHMAQIDVVKTFTIFSPFQNHVKKKDNNFKLKALLLQNIKEQEQDIQKRLGQSYDKDLFEKAIYLKNAKATLKTRQDGKIVIRGRLKDNIHYQTSVHEMVGYFLIGLCFIFFLLGLIIIIETIIFPRLTFSMSILFLLYFGSGLVFFLLYKHYFKKDEEGL